MPGGAILVSSSSGFSLDDGLTRRERMYAVVVADGQLVASLGVHPGAERYTSGSGDVIRIRTIPFTRSTRIQEYDLPGADRPNPLWTVFDPEGQVLGFVETPAGLRIYEIGEDYILGRGHRRPRGGIRAGLVAEPFRGRVGRIV